jgi:hypothetical protein
MQTLIGDLGQPLPDLAIDIVKVGELAQGPEVLPEITDGAFDLAFFPTTGRIAGSRVKTIFPSEAEKARQKTDQASVMFSDRGGEIVVDDFPRDTAQCGEGVNVTANECSETLAVSELRIEHAAVRIHQCEGVQLTGVAGIVERAEVAPIDFEAFSGERFHAHEGALRRELRANFLQILAQNTVATAITERVQSLFNDGAGDTRIFPEPFGNVALEWIELARALALSGRLRRRFQILLDRAPAHLEVALDFANGPMLGPVKAVQVVDLIGGQHGPCILYPADAASKPEGCCLQDGGTGPGRGASVSITHTWAGTELLFARWAVPAPTSQTCAAECFRSRAEVLLARWRSRRLRSRACCC